MFFNHHTHHTPPAIHTQTSHTAHTSHTQTTLSCSIAGASSSGKLRSDFVAFTKGCIPLGRRSSRGSCGLSACSTTLDARAHKVRTVPLLTLLVRWLVRTSPVLLSVGAFFQVSVPQLPAKFLLLPPWLQSLTSQMAPLKANKTRNVLNVCTTTTLRVVVPSHGSAEARTASHCKERTSCQHTPGGATGRGVTAQTNALSSSCHRPCCAPKFCIAMPAGVGQLGRVFRGAKAPPGWDSANFLAAESGTALWLIHVDDADSEWGWCHAHELRPWRQGPSRQQDSTACPPCRFRATNQDVHVFG